jgi:hypothetical protein
MSIDGIAALVDRIQAQLLSTLNITHPSTATVNTNITHVII